jgi:hypothetical protein
MWDMTVKAINGEYQRKKLERIHRGDYLAFAWFAFILNIYKHD